MSRNGKSALFSGGSLQARSATDPLLVIGHRGWPGRYPDNTLAGIGAASGVVPMVEVDVRRTSDGALVLSHDPVIRGRVIAGSSWEELAGIDLGSGHRPVRLDEALAVFPDRSFDLEVKNHPQEPGFDPGGHVAVATARLARGGDLLTSFHWASMDVVREIPDAVDTGLLVDRPDAGGGAGATLDRAFVHALAGGHRAVLPRAELILEAEDAGGWDPLGDVAVIAWTVNDREVAKRLASLGVSAIITDDPGRMTLEPKERE